MLATRKTLFLGNLLLIAAIGNIDLPNAGGNLFESLNLPDLGFGDILFRKLRTSFNRFDFNDDGYISRGDMEGIAEEFAEQENFNQVDKEAAIKSFSDLFTFTTSSSGSKDDVLLTEKMMADSIKMQKDDTECKNRIGAVLKSFVTPMKVVQKGFLTSDEYSRLFKSLGFSNVVFTFVAFLAIDTNHDLRVSDQEFYDAATSYMCTDDSSFTLLLGQLL